MDEEGIIEHPITAEDEEAIGHLIDRLNQRAEQAARIEELETTISDLIRAGDGLYEAAANVGTYDDATVLTRVVPARVAWKEAANRAEGISKE